MKICDFCNGKNVVTTIAVDPFGIGKKEMTYKWLKKAVEYDVCGSCLEKLENTIINECEVKDA